MDARLQFEWNGEKAKEFVSAVFEKGFFPGNEDIVDRADSDYEITLYIKLKQKRKPRKLKTKLKSLEG